MAESYSIYEAEEFEPQPYLIGCTCEHPPEHHSWEECEIEGCPCTGHWEE